MPDNISKHNNALTAEERTRNARKAGIRSGEIRREHKRLKDAILDRVTDDDLTKIVDGLIERAKHNTRDFEVLRDTIGEKPKETVSLNDREPVTIRIHRVPRPGEEADSDK